MRKVRVIKKEDVKVKKSKNVGENKYYGRKEGRIVENLLKKKKKYVIRKSRYYYVMNEKNLK
jgi:hypothetical protein